jgi:hypothetical protein
MWTAFFITLLDHDDVVFVVHVYLLGGDVLATWMVAAGIIWDSSPPVKHVAHRLVIWGVVLETLCSIALFTFDEGLSGAQQSKIIALETRLAARTLSDAQVDALAARLKPLNSQHFDIVTYWKNPESLNITNRIYAALIKAGWIYDKPPSGEFILGVQTGVTALYDKRAPGVEKAATAFLEGLKANGIDAADDGQNPPANEPINPKLTINVGIKP